MQPSSGAYPATVEFDPPGQIARWRPLVHWLLAIPHLVVLWVLGIVASVVAVIAWFAIVFSGRLPKGLGGLLALTVRYQDRVLTYVVFLREEYPPFSFDTTFADPGDDPRVRVGFAEQLEDRNRATVFFRFLMVIPHAIVLWFVTIGAYVVGFVGFFAVLITGRWPDGLQRFVLGYVRWTTRFTAYAYLLTDEYPPFSLD